MQQNILIPMNEWLCYFVLCIPSAFSQIYWIPWCTFQLLLCAWAHLCLSTSTQSAILAIRPAKNDYFPAQISHSPSNFVHHFRFAAKIYYSHNCIASVSTTHDACIIIFHLFDIVSIPSIDTVAFINSLTMARGKSKEESRREQANSVKHRRHTSVHCVVASSWSWPHVNVTWGCMTCIHSNTPSIALPSNNLLFRQAPDIVVSFDFNANIKDELDVW